MIVFVRHVPKCPIRTLNESTCWRYNEAFAQVSYTGKSFHTDPAVVFMNQGPVRQVSHSFESQMYFISPDS